MTGTFSRLCQEMRDLLNKPLPGDRGFQTQRDREIIALARKISIMEPPIR